MRYPPSLLEEIRARLPVSTIVGRRVQLRKAGREWKGLSPFNAEKSPSFFVNDQKQFYHCFSSAKHGDIFTFVMETEGLSFPEAVERLAGEAGVDLPRDTRESQENEARRRTAIEVMEFAAAFFEASLEDRAGARARDYLAGRQLGPDVRRRFRIGYAPADRYALRDHLAAKGISREAMIELGLVVAEDERAVAFDRFRDRVMFPIADARGRVIAFGGRALSADVPAKYLNSPETPLFHKGEVLYNLHHARKAAHDRGGIVAVEGYVDVIAMTLAGHPHTVAPLGTALTEAQLDLLWRVADEPVLCFDGDKAGRRAAYRALDLALPALGDGKSLRFALLPEGQDPDDLLRTQGAEAIDRVLEGARPLVEVLWTRETEAGPVDTPEQRAALARRLRAAVATMRDATLRGYYRDEIETRLRAAFSRSWTAGGRGAPDGRRQGAKAPFGKAPYGRPPEPPAKLVLSQTSANAGGVLRREAYILVCLARYPDLLGRLQDEVAGMTFTSPAGREAARLLVQEVVRAAEEEREIAAVEGGPIGELEALIHEGNRKYVRAPFDIVAAERLLMQALGLHRRMTGVRRELKEAQADLASLHDAHHEHAVFALQEDFSSLDGLEADERSVDGGERPMDEFLDGVLEKLGFDRRRG